jgi:lactate dehydrogenase-like 2-hydroxyacid dehydrogenase
MSLNLINTNKVVSPKYSSVLFRDKVDLDEHLKKVFIGAHFLGSMEKLTVCPDIEILSVKFSKVGETVLRKLPNLKYIVCRSHSFDNINLKLCHLSNIKVITTNPTSISVAKYIHKYLVDFNISGPHIIYGFGNIGKSLAMLIDDALVINSKTTRKEIDHTLLQGKTVIITIPLNKQTKGIFDHNFFSRLKQCKLMINISKYDVFDEEALVSFVEKSGCFLVCDTHKQFECENTLFTDHTAWKFALNSEDYIHAVKQGIDSCY